MAQLCFFRCLDVNFAINTMLNSQINRFITKIVYLCCTPKTEHRQVHFRFLLFDSCSILAKLHLFWCRWFFALRINLDCFILGIFNILCICWCTPFCRLASWITSRWCAWRIPRASATPNGPLRFIKIKHGWYIFLRRALRFINWTPWLSALSLGAFCCWWFVEVNIFRTIFTQVLQAGANFRSMKCDHLLSIPNNPKFLHTCIVHLVLPKAHLTSSGQALIWAVSILLQACVENTPIRLKH